MAAPGSGDPRPSTVEVLDDGRGPESLPGSLGRLGDRGRRVVGAAFAVALLVAAVAVVTHRPDSTDGPSPSARPGTVPSFALGDATSIDPVQLLTDQYSYSTTHGTLRLTLSIINYGPTAVDIVDTQLPQPGTRPLPGPGGGLSFANPVRLLPDVPTDLTVLATVSCPGVLTQPLTDHIDVTLGEDGHPDRVASLPLSALGTILDEARHQACGVISASAAIVPSMVDGSVRAVAGGGADPDAIESRLQIRDVGGVRTTVRVAGGEPDGVTVSVVGAAHSPVVLTKDGTATVLLRWSVTDCAALQAVRWPTLELTISVPTSTVTDAYGFDQTFGTAWRQALAQVCPAATP
jgi:hypothetical protein